MRLQTCGSSMVEEIDQKDHPNQNTPARLQQVHGPTGTAASSRAAGPEHGRKAGAATAPDEPFHLVTMLPSSDQNLSLLE